MLLLLWGWFCLVHYRRQTLGSYSLDKSKMIDIMPVWKWKLAKQNGVTVTTAWPNSKSNWNRSSEKCQAGRPKHPANPCPIKHLNTVHSVVNRNWVKHEPTPNTEAASKAAKVSRDADPLYSIHCCRWHTWLQGNEPRNLAGLYHCQTMRSMWRKTGEGWELFHRRWKVYGVRLFLRPSHAQGMCRIRF